MDRFVHQIGASPYAVVAGLLLSAIPLYVLIFKIIWKSIKFSYGVAKIGYKKQLVRSRRKNARIAYRIINKDRHAEYLFRETFIHLSNIMFNLLYAMAAIGFVVTDTPDYSTLVLSKAAAILFIAVTCLINYMATILLNMVKVTAIFSVRRRFIRRSTKRAFKRL